MTNLWLIVNSASGSYDAAIPDRLSAVAQAAGANLSHTITIPDDDLPTRTMLEQAGVDMVMIHTGDGTINTVARSLEGWAGSVLVLPGGTMNLLARTLHGDDAEADAIVARALGPDARHQPVTVVESNDSDADIWGLVGLFAGPTTAWGDVRETMRRREIGAMIDHVRRAISDTFNGDQVCIAGDDASYPAIYVEPANGKLRLMGYAADGAGDLFKHGFAWMGGDFRNGPHDMLGEVEDVIIDCAADTIGLLVDGERGHARAPLHLRAIQTPVNFVATAPITD